MYKVSPLEVEITPFCDVGGTVVCGIGTDAGSNTRVIALQAVCMNV